MNDGGTLVGKSQAHRRHVFDAGRDVGAAAAVDRDRLLAHDGQDDRNVVRSEVPGDVDVFLEQPQIQTPRADVADVADVPLVNDFFHFPHDGRIEKRMAGHQHQAVLGGDVHQLFALLDGTGHRFFNESVFARKQGSLGHWIVGAHAGGDGHGIQIDAVEHVVVVRFTGHFGIKRFEMLEPRGVDIAHRLEPAVGQRPEIPD